MVVAKEGELNMETASINWSTDFGELNESAIWEGNNQIVKIRSSKDL